MVGAPAAWRFYAISFAAMVALAGLDLVGAVLAKEWAETTTPPGSWLRLATFGILFAVYANSLRVAELSVVTLGWVVLLQVGLVMLDRFRYGIDLPPGKWLAIAAILVLQGYLMLAPNNGNGPSSNQATGYDRTHRPRGSLPLFASAVSCGVPRASRVLGRGAPVSSAKGGGGRASSPIAISARLSQ